MSRTLRIAVDGPAASGKGTVARMVARALGYAYVDTGAMYRCVGLAAARAGLSLDDGDSLGALTTKLQISFSWRGEEQRVLLNGEDVTEQIRTADAGRAASDVAVLPQVRAALLDRQRALGDTGGVVMDGRDIGTMVLPEAELKVFLDAGLEERARRRWAELEARGSTGLDQAQVRAELVERDRQDTGRSTAPLVQATDAVYLDTTGLSPAQAADRVVAMAHALVDGPVMTG